MKKEKIVEDILKLRTAANKYNSVLDELYDCCPRYSKCNVIADAAVYAYHVMPVSCIGSVYSDYEELFRENCEWVSDERFTCKAWERDVWERKEKDMELIVNLKKQEGGRYDPEVFRVGYKGGYREGELPCAYGVHCYVYCRKVVKSNGRWVLILADPYGEFCTQPYSMSDDRAHSLVGKLLLVRLNTEYDLPFKENDFVEFWNRAVDENDRVEALYDRQKPIFRTYEGIRYRELRTRWFESGYMYEGHKIQRPVEVQHYLDVVKSYSGVASEEEAIFALNMIESVSNRKNGVLCYKRFSQTELYAVMQDKTLYEFFYSNGMLCFSKEKDHMYEGEYCKEKDGSVRSVTEEEAYSFRFREGVDFRIEIWTQGVNEAHRDEFNRDYFTVGTWDKYEAVGIREELTGKGKIELKKMRKHLQCVTEQLYERCMDRIRYGAVRYQQKNTTTEHVEDWEWNYVLCDHPEYYMKWKGTFFDKEHDLANYLLTKADDCGNNGNLVKGRPLIWHKYCLKNGAKSPFENLDVYSFEFIRRAANYRLDSDYCVRYIGYCDSASCADGLTTVHLIDTYGDAYFNNIELPPELVNASVGRMICLTCAYNYFEKDEFRMMKYQVLPYTLTEKLGEYKEDELVVSWDINLIRKEN